MSHNEDKQFFTMLGLSVVVCRNKEGKFLAVNETRSRGWWLPAGKVDPPENFFVAAIREAKEEAGIDVELKGILRTEYDIRNQYQRLRVIFYAEPKDEKQKPKSIPDKESEEARWMSLKEMEEIDKTDLGWRGPELYEWANYLEQGGLIYPLSFLSPEGSKVEVETDLDNIKCVVKNNKGGLKKGKKKFSCCSVQ